MRALLSLSRSLHSLLLRRLLSPPSPLPLLSHSLTTLSPSPPPSPPSQIIHSDPTQTPNPNPQTETQNEDDEAMNEFLSRFVHSLKPKLSESFPGLTRQMRDEMLLLICQKVISKLDGPDSPDDPSIELSEDLWRTVWEISNSVHEAMKRDKMRAELKKYLHCDEVKQMCRFAGDVGIRGPMLRELRFKWAREKLDEVEFYRNLEKMREDGSKKEEGRESEKERKLLTGLPERKGKIKYKIFGLDLSDPKWAEVAERTELAERKFVPDEPKIVEVKCVKVEEGLIGLDLSKKDFDFDLGSVLMEWKDLMDGPRRVDWIALLDRIKEKNSDLYFKVMELLLTEESFEPTIRDYSKLIDLHSKSNQVEDANRILQKMTEMGIKPDIITYITLVHMYSKSGNLDLAKESFEILKKSGFQPDLKLYTSLVNAYIKSGQPKQGEMLTREMETRDIKPTKEIYMDLLRAFAELGQVDGAQRIMNTMQFAGINPNLESYTLLVEVYGQAGDPDQARAHFDQMVKSSNKPDDRCTASMLNGYMKKNLLDKALDLLLTLERDGFQSGIFTNTMLADWLGRLQLVDEAERVVSKIRETGEDPFELNVSMCDMYARARMREKMDKCLKVLEGKRKVMNGEQFERIVSGLLAGGFLEEAEKMYNLMQGRGFVPSEPVKVALMAAQSIPRQRRLNRDKGR